jgi:hypothetical protein
MFEKLAAPDNVIAMRLSETLTTDDVEQYKTIIEDKLATHERFGICVDMTELTDIGTDALTKDAWVELELLVHITKFRRCALVSSKKWPTTMALAIGHWIPLLEVKAFEPGECEAAIAWASRGPAVPEAEKTSASHAAE